MPLIAPSTPATTSLDPKVVALQVFTCKTCKAAPTKGCVTASGLNKGKPYLVSGKAALHADRLANAVGWIFRQPELDQLQARVTELEMPPAPAPDPDEGPIRLASVAEAKQRLPHLPTDATFVSWGDVAVAGDTLEDVFTKLGPNDLLVLPERTTPLGVPIPYPLDASEGFRADGVSAVRGAGGTKIPVVSKFKGKTARTWFALARARYGILGLGPNAVVGIGALPKSPIAAQISHSTATDPGRTYWNGDGAQALNAAGKPAELLGAAEKLIETERNVGYYGNFTLAEAPDLGGIAFHGIALKSGTVERVAGAGAWRGFADVPNGETGAVTFNGPSYLVSRCHFDGRTAAGKRVGPSPLMVNNSHGGRVETTTLQCSIKGMPTWWNCTGVHEVVDCDLRWNAATLINLEQALDGFELRMTGGSLWSGAAPSTHTPPDGIAGKTIIGLDARGAVKITLIGVDVDVLAAVSGYGSTKANLAKVTATRDDQPIKTVAA